MSEPTGPAGGDLAGEYPAPTVAHVSGSEAVGLAALVSAVRAKLLGPAAVITEYLAAGAVTTSALSEAVQAKLLGAGNVTEANLAGEAVSEGKLTSAVRALLLGAGRVITSYLAANAVTEEKLSEAVQVKLAAIPVFGKTPTPHVSELLVEENREPSATKWVLVAFYISAPKTTERGVFTVTVGGVTVVDQEVKYALTEKGFCGVALIPPGGKYTVNSSVPIKQWTAVEYL